MGTKTSTLILLMTFLVSCKVPYKAPEVMYTYHGKMGLCLARCYDLVVQETVWPAKCDIESAVPQWEVPMEECDGISGFKNAAIGERIKPWLNRLKRKNKRKYKKIMRERGY